jgi:L-seryl-tRNA(Ser) seleniumtransferase
MLTYQDLGIKPFINAGGTVTSVGGSLMPSEVIDAMRAASRAFIDLGELHVRAGEKLAQMIGVPAAFISCGAASGMQLGAAACLTGTDPERIRTLPDTRDIRNEFVISMVDQHTYIHQGIKAVGGKLVRVGTEKSVSAVEIIGGIGKNTAAIVFFLGKQPKSQLMEITPEATKRGVPVIVDAAAQLPPRSNLTELVEIGASLVVFSGGKGLRGPQSSGLVLGKAEFVEAVRLNSNPHSAIGRGMKVGKEEIMGLLTAVELFLAKDEGEELAEWHGRIAHIIQALQGIDGVQAEIRTTGQAAPPDITPRAYITLADSYGLTPHQVTDELRAGDPPILVKLYGEEYGIEDSDDIAIDPMTLMPGEAEVIARRLVEVLM